MLRTSEWALGINHPWRAEQETKPRGEGLGILQQREFSMEAEFVIGVQRFETLNKLAPEHLLEHRHRQEELLLEDFIAMKVFAGGPMDMIDAARAISAAEASLDLDLVRRLAKRFGRESSESLERLLKR